MKFSKTIAVASTALMVLFTSCGESTKTTQDADSAVAATPTYSKDATVLSLCFLSNIASGYDSLTSDALLSLTDSLMNTVLTDTATIACIGTWTPVWGPCIYSDPLADSYTAADLTMVLLKGKNPEDTSETMYVLSMSGTNNVSVYDWLYVNLKPTSMFQWPAPIPGKSNVGAFSSASSGSTAQSDTAVTNSGNYISTGMALGLKDLLVTMKNNNGSGKSLIDYLQANVTVDSTAELAVTGHSMGGALSPCVALSLKDNQSYWDPQNHFTITAYPFAGPSPGNANFAQYFMNTIDSVNFHGWYNTNDIAPRILNTASMLTIATLYDTVSGFPQQQCLAEGIFACLADQLNGFNYTSLYGPSNSFGAQDSLAAGSYNTYLADYNALSSNDQGQIKTIIGMFPQCNTLAPDSVMASFDCFGALVIQQHFDAYRNNFDCSTVFDMIQSAQGPGPNTNTGLAIFYRVLTESLLSNCNQQN